MITSLPRLAGRIATVPAWAILTSLAIAQDDKPSNVQSKDGNPRAIDRIGATHELQETGLLQGLDGWYDLRDRLDRRGYRIQGQWITDASWVPAGGRDPGTTALRDLLDLSVGIETSRAFGFPGGRFLVGFQAIGGKNGSNDIGVVQAVSNIDAEDRFEIARIWYEQELPDSGTTVRVGKIDANSLFAYTDNGSRFIHSSAGVSPNILGLPTYPDPAFGAMARQQFAEGVEVSMGVFDGAAQEGVRTGSNGPRTLFGEPSDLFLIGELGLAWDGPRAGRLGLGAWRHTGTFARFDGGDERGTDGLYCVLDQGIMAARAPEDRALDGFMQLAIADPEVSAVALHFGTGLVWSHSIDAGKSDAFGIALEIARLSDKSGAGFTERDEIAVESFYSWSPTSFVRVKPDLQYIVNPGGDSHENDAVVLGLRVILSL